MKRVRLETSRILDWQSLHDEFARLFGFPDFYGRNMDAWIDCMSYIDEPEGGMTTIHVRSGEPLLLEVTDAEGFWRRCPEQFEALVDCSSFVNRRFVDDGLAPMLCLVFVEDRKW